MNGGDGVGGGGGGGSTFQHSSAADVAAAAIARKRFVLRTASSESDGGLGAEWRFSPPPPPEDEDWEGGEYEYGRGPGSDRKSNPAHAQKLYNVSHSTSSSSSVASRVFWSLSLSSYKFTNSSIPRPYACAPACLSVCLPACLPACLQPSTLDPWYTVPGLLKEAEVAGGRARAARARLHADAGGEAHLPQREALRGVVHDGW